jgi:hypothetical protein
MNSEMSTFMKCRRNSNMISDVTLIFSEIIVIVMIGML